MFGGHLIPSINNQSLLSEEEKRAAGLFWGKKCLTSFICVSVNISVFSRLVGCFANKVK